MKKLIALVLMVTYMACAIGFTFSFHYCGGKFMEICFTSDTDKNCCGTKEKAGGCCEDKVVSAKHKDNHAPSAKALIAKVFFLDFIALPSFAFKAEKIRGEDFSTYIAKDLPPPLIVSKIPLYLLIRVLKI